MLGQQALMLSLTACGLAGSKLGPAMTAGGARLWDIQHHTHTDTHLIIASRELLKEGRPNKCLHAHTMVACPVYQRLPGGAKRYGTYQQRQDQASNQHNH
jgi:hypothetical protein